VAQSDAMPFVAQVVDGKVQVGDPAAFAVAVSQAHAILDAKAVPAQAMAAQAPAVEPPPNDGELLHRYYLAYCRLLTGQIDGLELDDLEDIACCGIAPCASFRLWKIKKGLDNAKPESPVHD
jgi:hypothetical protein